MIGFRESGMRRRHKFDEMLIMAEVGQFSMYKSNGVSRIIFWQLIGLCASALFMGCANQVNEFNPDSPIASRVKGTWRAELQSPGGPLPFGIEFRMDGDDLLAWAINGEERAKFSSAKLDGKQLRLDFDWYDSWIVADYDLSTEQFKGKWQKTGPGGKPSTLPFVAKKGAGTRFELSSDKPAVNVDGRWQVTFKDDSGEEKAEAVFHQSGSEVTGTFLTEVGDYRYLEGNVADNELKLSTFDGAHAFLFAATLDGDQLSGDFWSRDSYHATWTATRIEGVESELGNEWELAKITNASGRFRFSFPDLEGKIVSSDDERFKNRPMLINIFGSWCPNCNDKAPILADWHREFRDQGLEVVGLAFEFTGDPKRDTEVLRRFRRRHNIEYDILLAGTNDKQLASEKLPDLSRVIAYPQTIFVGKDGVVKHVHTGFSGPGTVEKHTRLVEEMRKRIVELLE